MQTTQEASEFNGTPGGAETQHLKGRLGVIAIVFTVLAFNAPLGVAAGFVPIVIGAGNREGAPSTFVGVALILLIFSVGLLAMSRYMTSRRS